MGKGPVWRLGDADKSGQGRYVMSKFTKISRAFNEKVKPRDIQEGGLVLKEIRVPIQDPIWKFRLNWLGPYIIKTIVPKVK